MFPNVIFHLSRREELERLLCSIDNLIVANQKETVDLLSCPVTPSKNLQGKWHRLISIWLRIKHFFFCLGEKIMGRKMSMNEHALSLRREVEPQNEPVITREVDSANLRVMIREMLAENRRNSGSDETINIPFCQGDAVEELSGRQAHSPSLFRNYFDDGRNPMIDNLKDHTLRKKSSSQNVLPARTRKTTEETEELKLCMYSVSSQPAHKWSSCSKLS
jgi:hypothetical protein